MKLSEPVGFKRSTVTGFELPIYPTTGDIFYRYEDQVKASFNGDGDHIRSWTVVQLIELPVARHTPKGASLRKSIHDPETRFVCNQTVKQYARSTKEAALRDFIARKTKQRAIYLRRADTLLSLIREANSMMESYRPVEA